MIPAAYDRIALREYWGILEFVLSYRIGDGEAAICHRAA